MKAGEGPADGLRPPRLQDLRPARQDHQADRRRGLRGHGQEPAARHRARARAHRARRTTTSSRASSTRTSTSTRASSTRRWASRSRCSRCCSPSRAPPAGSRSGKRCCSTRSRRSRGRARSTSAHDMRDYVPREKRALDAVAQRVAPLARAAGRWPRASHGAQPPASPSAFDSATRLGAPPAARGHRSAPRRLARRRSRPAATSRRSSRRSASRPSEQAVRRRHAARPGQHGQPDRATLPGASADRIVVAGHYDTKLFRDFRFVGANDGGSSAAFLIELARVLKGRTQRASRSSCSFSTAKKRSCEWHGQRPHLRQPPLRRGRAPRRHAQATSRR